MTPENVSIFKAEEDLLGVRVVSNAFQGMTFSDRFKQLGDMVQAQNPDELAPFVFIFEAFTPEELLSFPKSGGEGKVADSVSGFKRTAKDVDLT